MTTLVCVNVINVLPLVNELTSKILNTVGANTVTEAHRIAIREYIFNRMVVTNLNSYRLYRYSSVTDYVRYDLAVIVNRYKKEINHYSTQLPCMYNTIILDNPNETIINTLLVNDILYVSLNET